LITNSLGAGTSQEQAVQPPPLQPFSTIRADAAGGLLQKSMIWADPAQKSGGETIAFRKTWDIAEVPGTAILHLFADARYILWVNGAYVERGPARFQPNGPEYDSIDIAPQLRRGRNAIALLVVGNLSGGKIMLHPPGLTAMLEADGKETFRTDATWMRSINTRFQTVTATWPDLGETLVDARVEDGDWTQADYNDPAWTPATPISGGGWGALTARRIPRLRETPVPVTLGDGKMLPLTLGPGDTFSFTTGRIVQAYPRIEFTAEEGSELTLAPFGLKYIAKAGPQSHFTIDSRGISKGEIAVTKGSATFTSFQLIERLYPFERLGTFQSDDEFLNRLWEMCARSCEVLSEDAYVDCADRERVEWMDNTPPGYDVTRTAMAGPAGSDGKPTFSDPRLLWELIRRTALTLQPDGWVKAHTCSDRYDKHAKMEDRACDWVEGIHLFYEATGDAAAVKEIWPAVIVQMEYFLTRWRDRGLISARDWVVWGNPLGYKTGQTTTLNVFIARAFADTARLAKVVGNKEDETRFSRAADDLKTAINSVLWDERSGNYYSGYFSEDDLAANSPDEKFAESLGNGFTPPNLHANLFALDRGVVPDDRRDRVIAYVLSMALDPEKFGSHNVMLFYYLFKQMYAQDRGEWDTRVLTYLRKQWKPMVESPLQCSWESFMGGSSAHIYGMHPGYFLSAYVLGVRRDAPVAERELLIEPHLGDLKRAQGVVVTEFGAVPVSYKVEANQVAFEVTVPADTKTTLALPRDATSVVLDGQCPVGTFQGSRRLFNLNPGKHTGNCSLPQSR